MMSEDPPGLTLLQEHQEGHQLRNTGIAISEHSYVDVAQFSKDNDADNDEDDDDDDGADDDDDDGVLVRGATFDVG